MVNFLENRNPEALKYLETGLEKPRYRFWQAGGGYDRNYWSTEEIIQRVDYIHNNPVKRGLVEDPCDWPWSSAREWLTGEKGPIPIDRRSFPIS
jgi:putative transposase